MKKTKILYTIPNFNTAGSGKVLYDLANGLDKSKFDVHIACSSREGIFFNEVEKLNLPIHIVETTCKPRPYWNVLSRIKPYKNFIKKNDFDVVHSWHWSSDWTEVLGAKLGGAKFVYTKKAMSWGNIHWKIRSFLSDFIVTINEEMRNYFPNKKAQKLIPIGIDLDYYNSKHFQVSKNSNYFNIISVANLVPVKGIEVLIDAVCKLANPKIKLSILGDNNNEYGKTLQQKVNELGMQDQIVFLGKHKDVRPFLVNSDLYVIPTLNEGRKEGMPMALVEAMCMSIPVLGSDISGINFVLKDFSEYLFEASNSDELAAKINLMISKAEEERENVGSTLRNYVVNNFSMEQFISSHEELYLKLAKK